MVVFFSHKWSCFFLLNFVGAPAPTRIVGGRDQTTKHVHQCGPTRPYVFSTFLVTHTQDGDRDEESKPSTSCIVVRAGVEVT